MTDTRKAQLIRYRLEQAEEALREARTLLDSGSQRASVNRSYYAMFYSVLALLITRDLGTSKHSGAISLFDREFKQAGIFSKELSDWLHESFELRLDADYREMVTISTDKAKESLSHAQEFVARIKGHLSQQFPGAF